MIGQSGCFGSIPNNETIDNAAELSAAVDGILETVAAEANDENQDVAALVMAQHYAYLNNRVRMITWAVVAIAAYIIFKEIA